MQPTGILLCCDFLRGSRDIKIRSPSPWFRVIFDGSPPPPRQITWFVNGPLLASRDQPHVARVWPRVTFLLIMHSPVAQITLAIFIFPEGYPSGIPAVKKITASFRGFYSLPEKYFHCRRNSFSGGEIILAKLTFPRFEWQLKVIPQHTSSTISLITCYLQYYGVCFCFLSANVRSRTYCNGGLSGT